MRNHKYSDLKQTDNIQNVQFAYQFFKIVDQEDTGSVLIENLAIPLIALGISSDQSFIEKVMKSINPKRFGEQSGLEDPFSINEICLKEIISIFRKDQVSEKLTEELRQGVIQERLLAHQAK